MKNTTIRLGGVPEHFNLPVHLAKEKGAFAARGVDLEWTTFKGGTGQMTKALRNDEVDACILLTEGIITDIANGNPSLIISEYVTSPLIWGIHTGTENSLRHHSDIYDKRYAISRFGSGSNLMAIVDAHSQGKSIDTQQFHIIKNLDGALTSLTNMETDVFYWEKYTTKPYVDSGQLRRVGEYLTPWPCFMIAATQKAIDEKPETLIRMLRTIHDSCDYFMQSDDHINLVAKRYELLPNDVAHWYHKTSWAIHGWVSNKVLKNVVYHLKTANILKEDQGNLDLVWKR